MITPPPDSAEVIAARDMIVAARNDEAGLVATYLTKLADAFEVSPDALRFTPDAQGLRALAFAIGHLHHHRRPSPWSVL